jgi:hypothetical protein
MFIFEAKPNFMKVFYSRLKSLYLIVLLTLAVLQNGSAQCVSVGSIVDPGCGGSTTVNKVVMAKTKNTVHHPR